MAHYAKRYQCYALSVVSVLIIFSTTGCEKNASSGGGGNNIPKDSIITTVAGNGTWGFSGDGGLAVNAQLSQTCEYVCVDSKGNLYLSDRSNNRIRRVGNDGVIRTLVGSGVNGFSPNGTVATSAALELPAGLRTNATDALYFTVGSNIRLLTPSGTVISVAGGATFTIRLGDGGPATADTVKVWQPKQIAFAKNGDMYIADWANHRVRKVSAATGIITTVAGNGKLGTTAEGVLATNTQVQYPNSVAIDAENNLYISAGWYIRKVSPIGTISTYAGTGSGAFNKFEGPATSVNIWPTDICLNNIGELLVANYATGLVFKIDKAGYLSTIAGGAGSFAPPGDGGKPRNARLIYPSGIACDANGNIYIADYGDRRIRKISVK